ncbi:MAG TPA: AAA family ATPase [Mycobacteriales bacterium]|nr:AAA family ATPase [Mycobacteriales bacterium]
MDRLHVLTGGPGGGKTTLVERLAALGYATTPEAGRAILRDQAAIGGPLRPEVDPVAFLEAILQWELRSYRWAAATEGPVFLDRGVPDVAGAYRQLGRPVPAHVTAAVAAFRYAPAVFVAPPWPDIYVHDEERKHSWESAVRTYEVMVEAYGAAGYELVELPRMPVEDRVAFVLDAVGLA